ncbi:TetR/AcrR family transcriptional regulator [Luxibacter massiliensis]|uniref:TetR/AcrR family transcriptional regulator n=1 Tax=Luxibacter massiliensis TaxID=2219695 RepID=UPI000F054608|nr:TetR/AcrR family transcriptional regulator [Luxibacter massiliensis]
MEDKRVRKTKKNLKATLISMLSDMPFEQISITELYMRADTSRITFYAHYNDKYALADDIFQDMIQAGTSIYENMQSENNPGKNVVTSYCNVLDSILKLYYENFDFFRHTVPDKNPYLAFSFYNYILATVEMHTNKESKVLKLKYSAKKIAGFICYGMAGFINESHSDNTPLDVIHAEAKELLGNVLRSDILLH